MKELVVKRRNAGRIDSDGYRIVPAPGHPLAREDGSVREHRMVHYDRVGPGVHPCHWCGWPVSWDVTYRPGGSREEKWSALIVDHLDGDRANNAPENLRTACPFCNSNRGGMARAGRQPADFTDVPPWVRPLFGNVAAETHSRRKLRRARVGTTVLPPRPAVPEVEPPSPAEDKAQEALGAELYGDAAVPVDGPAPARRPVGPNLRWGSVVVVVAAGLAYGWVAGLVVLVVWWLWVAPPVRLRRRRPLVVEAGRAWRSWDSVLGGGGGSARPPVVVPVERSEPEPDDPDDDEDEPEPEPGPVDFDPVEEVEEAEDDEEPGGVLIPLRRPGLPPPPKRRR